MQYGHFGPGIIFFGGLHVIVVAGVIYFFCSISKSLKRIADSLEKK